ncbi:MAG: 2-polyprenyl-3-methyl-6-methoxy-1,4-benzoquinone monooxygenase [Proteobacteria bacterium]|jgi:ubiquinone biosynthesis monooxygenase Coq7|nr:2-polyprenyl-3-methyl-6-methoxy-1,4-benzoquinone monooxygenase [Pseudomonadota bacterium]
MLDKIITELDTVIKNLFTQPVSVRPHPDKNLSEGDLTDKEKKHISSLMRINHCGEICAQGLYQGQSITSRNSTIKNTFKQAAFEETEHLAWTKKRIEELGGHISILNPLFYAGSLAIGITAGILGDKWSLGFLEETEYQVEAHLNKHLNEIPSTDEKSKAILTQMKEDEMSHAEMAHNHGAAALPSPVKFMMQMFSKVMTKTTYYI